MLLVAAALAAAAAVSLLFVRPARVDGSSMAGTLNDGDIILLEQCSYRGGEPQRGDIIAFCKKDVAPGLIIKRIAALPGEMVEISDGVLYIDGSVLPSYFVLGDNLAESVDSRAWPQPFVHKNEIRGRYWCRIASFG